MSLYGALVDNQEIVHMAEIDSVMFETRHSDRIAEFREERGHHLPVRLIADNQANRRPRRGSDDRESLELSCPSENRFRGGHTVYPSFRKRL